METYAWIDENNFGKSYKILMSIVDLNDIWMVFFFLFRIKKVYIYYLILIKNDKN